LILRSFGHNLPEENNFARKLRTTCNILALYAPALNNEFHI